MNAADGAASGGRNVELGDVEVFAGGGLKFVLDEAFGEFTAVVVESARSDFPDAGEFQLANFHEPLSRCVGA